MHSEGSSTQNWIFGYLESTKKWAEQDFSSFFAKFLVYLIIFQSFAEPSVSYTLKNYQICLKFGGNEDKSP